MNQANLNNIIGSNCKCCDEVWLSLLGATTDNITLFTENTNSNHIWELSKDNGITWTPFKTGGDTITISDVSLTSFAAVEDGDITRVKYIDSQDCTHYSEAALIFS